MLLFPKMPSRRGRRLIPEEHPVGLHSSEQTLASHCKCPAQGWPLLTGPGDMFLLYFSR